LNIFGFLIEEYNGIGKYLSLVLHENRGQMIMFYPPGILACARAASDIPLLPYKHMVAIVIQ